MLKNFVKNSFWIAIAFFGAQISYAQDNGPTVQNPFPAGSALINIGPNADGNLTLGGEYKQPKTVIEQQKPVFWTWAADVGYESQYNFRGTNLTPDSSGAGFIDAEVSKWNFTLGIYGIHQFGSAHANGWSMGEGGGGGAATPLFFPVVLPPPIPVQFIPITDVPTTTQTEFDELDVYLNYHLALGPVDLTVGNIAFFIQRDAQTVVREFAGPATFHFFGQTFFIPRQKFNHYTAPTVGDEQFDRVFVKLSTSKIPYITPSITYYQTIYNEGQDAQPYKGILPNGGPFERNEALGGYLDGRVRGNFPVTHWLTINPYGVISVSFHDRVEPVSNPKVFRDFIRGRTLSGWDVAQAGLELPIHLLQHTGTSTGPYAPPDVNLYLVPFAWYSYHISDPTPGTDRNEWWGGAKFTLTF
jgi:hypothetical protein